jgi:exosortase
MDRLDPEGRLEALAPPNRVLVSSVGLSRFSLQKAAEAISLPIRNAMTRSLTSVRIAAALLVVVAALWSYWPALTREVERWTTDSKYSHGYFVPLFALYLFGNRMRRAANAGALGAWTGSWWGLALLLASAAVHIAGDYFFVDWVSEIAFLPCLAGLCLCLGGWNLLRVAGPAIGFLCFMLPLPYRVEGALANPLQNLATQGSTYLLQTVGLSAYAEGNYVVLTEQKLNVLEACNGLGMLMTFFAVTTAVALVVKRPLLDKVIVVASAIPIALVANVIRITGNGFFGEMTPGLVANLGAERLDFCLGLLMMPLALGLIWLELQVLSRLLVDQPPLPAPSHAIGLNLDMALSTGPNMR